MNTAEYQRSVNHLFEKTAVSWEQIYGQQSVFARIHQHRGALILYVADGLKLPAGAPVLDVGCGAGLTALALAERGYRVTAVDPAQAMVARVAERAARDRLAGHLLPIRGDVCNLPFPEGTFNLVIAAGVLPWLADLEGPLREMRRVLRPGGHVIASVDNAWRLHLLLDACARTRMLLGNMLRRLGLRPTGAHARLHSVRAFDRALSDAGLCKVWSKTFGFGPFTLCGRKVVSNSRGLRVNDSLQRLADKGAPLLRSAGAQYLVLARKAA